MKKMIILLCILSIWVLAGCSGEAEEEQNVYQVYYPDRDYNRIAPLEYEWEEGANEVSSQVEQLLEDLAAPVSEVDYTSTIAGFTVKGYELQNEQITLNVSEEYKLLDPAREVLIRAAIVKTLTQLDSIVYVTIQVNGENLLDSLGEPVGVMNAGTFIDNTGEDMKNYEETEIVLYFANITGDRLIKVHRTLMYNTNTSKEKLVVEQLIRGPLNTNTGISSQTIATLNPETGIISVNVRDGICYVNLDDNFLVPVYTANADTVIYSLVNSLTELPGILKVQIAVEGETAVMYREQYDLSTLFEARDDLILVPGEEGQ